VRGGAPRQAPPFVLRKVHDRAAQVGAQVRHVAASAVYEEPGERLLYEVVGIHVRAPDHRCKAPERRVQLVQYAEVVGIPALVGSHCPHLVAVHGAQRQDTAEAPVATGLAASLMNQGSGGTGWVGR
jgi:hypothetical protein